MIARVWHGWTRPEKADPYERLLREEILPDIASSTPESYKGGDIFRRSSAEEVEFMTILWFESMEGVRAFVGEDVQQAHVPDKVRQLLHRYEETVHHYERRDRVS